MAGTFASDRIIRLSNLSLTQFNRHATLPTVEVRIFHADCRYDIILGRDILRDFGCTLDFDSNTISCNEVTIPMQPFPETPPEYTPQQIAQELLYNDEESRLLFNDDNTTFSDHQECLSSTSKTTILPSKYDGQSVQEIAAKCTHLSPQQRKQLGELLSEFPRLFDGTLRAYPHQKVTLELRPDAKPHRARCFPVPHSQRQLFKNELDRLVNIGVLEKCGRSEWIAGTFIIPKKDNRVRWITDFRGLNKHLVRKVYPLPRIADIISKRSGYQFLTKIDISMHYYTFELDDASKALCTIATPFGLYRYCRLPMGVMVAPDIAQELTEEVLQEIDESDNYMDDIAAFTSDWNHHLQMLRRLLRQLQDNNFAVNPSKCEWAVQETDFLGHWLTPTGIKPWNKKINAILALQPPTNLKQLRSFLGMVTYYRDMWPRRSHILAPLTDLLSKKHRKFVWDDACTAAFKRMRALVASDAILAYPDHNLPFDIETDASDFQLGAIIKQKQRPVAYYTRKLSTAQRNYTTIEKELLSIVETLREFRTMLLGARLRIYTDHRNLTHSLTSFTTQRVMRWRLLIEEYGPTFIYLPGNQNTIADALSRLPTQPVPTQSAKTTIEQVFSNFDSFTAEGLEAMPILDEFRDDVSLNECSIKRSRHGDAYLEFPRFDNFGRQPFHFPTIEIYQQQDQKLQNQLQTNAKHYFTQQLDSTTLICFLPSPKNPNDWRIAIPSKMLTPLVQWYHTTTAHTQGMDRLEATIRRHFHHPDLRHVVRETIHNCPICPKVRRGHSQRGLLAPRQAPIAPWSEVHVDSIGPWTVSVPGKGNNIKVRALTCIDPVTNLVEITRQEAHTAAESARLFVNTWLARYPRPLRCIHDNGSEFNGHNFQFMLSNAGIKSSAITSHTPTSNAIIESVHRSIGQVLRTLIHLRPPKTVIDANRLIDEALATALHACRCAAHTSLQHLSPGALVFQRDMFLNIPIIADLITITHNRQAVIDQRLLRANARRIRYDYRTGENVYVSLHRKANEKLKLQYDGPFPILRVHTNNTVTIQRGKIHERVSIRHIKPCPATPRSASVGENESRGIRDVNPSEPQSRLDCDTRHTGHRHPSS